MDNKSENTTMKNSSDHNLLWGKEHLSFPIISSSIHASVLNYSPFLQPNISYNLIYQHLYQVIGFGNLGCMELFHKAKTVRLRSYWDKYLIALDDQESVSQDRDGSTRNAIWTVEIAPGRDDDILRFISCYGKYLTASNVAFVLKTITGKKVLQTSPEDPSGRDPRTEWEPVRDGFQVKLKTLWGNYLRTNGGVPPWRNAITHDVPFRNTTHNKILWDVEVVESSAAARGHMNRRAHSDYTFDKSRTFTESNSSFLARTPVVRSTPPSDFV